MGCVSSKTTDESKDPPLEKQSNNTSAKIPEIQINGPPKDSEVSENNHVKTAAPPPSEKPPKPPAAPEEKEPMFPHVSPFKPQFDYRKDVVLSPRSSRYEETHGKKPDDETLMDNSFGGPETNSLERSAVNEKEPAPRAEGESIINTPRTPTKSLDFEGESRSKQLASSEPQSPEDEAVDCKSVKVTVKEPAADSSAAAEDDEAAVAGVNKPPTQTAADSQPAEDRSAILSSFLSSQSGPEVAADDADCVIVKPDNKVDPALQVEDEEMAAEAKPVTEEDSGAQGDVAAFKRPTENGEVPPMNHDDRKKLNEFLDCIESIHEKSVAAAAETTES
jgi:hypothetical protein